MCPMQFPKPPLTFEQQVALLRNRGMIINDEDFARRILTFVNYYRLSGYTLHLRTNDVFHSGVTFELVYQIYEFDQKLRYLLLEIIEVVEIAFRTHIAYHVAHNYGPLGYLDASYFENTDYHTEIVNELKELVERNKDKELYVRHHIQKYGGKFPVWVAVELFSFGMLSKFFKNMKPKDRELVSKQYYRFPSVYVANWLHVLVNLRNTCAHYRRIYNRTFTIVPRLGNKDKIIFRQMKLEPNRLFRIVFILKYLVTDKGRWQSFLVNIQALFEQHDSVDISLIGFPDQWYELLSA